MGVGPTIFALLSALMQQGVVCNTWKVLMPKSIMGVAGSCITVPCRFDLPKSDESHIQNCTKGVIWRKGKYAADFVFNEHEPYTNKLQGSVNGDLRRKDCTTTFYNFQKDQSDAYFFRADCTDYLKYTFQTGVIITVPTDIPAPLMSPMKPVAEGDLVKLQCSVPVPCPSLPPSLTWMNQQDTWQETKNEQNSTDGLTVMTSTLTFLASAEHHNRSVGCSVSYPLTTGGSTEPSATVRRINIQYAPRPPTVTLSPSAPVSEGDTVVLMCFSNANPPVSLYTWYRASNDQLIKQKEGRMLILQVRPSNTGLYLCKAQSQGSSQMSSPLSVEISTESIAGNHDYVLYIISGLLLVINILIVAVGLSKYKSLSTRLKDIELRKEHTYTDLRIGSITGDYEQIEPRQKKAKSNAENDNYENFNELKISKLNSSQNRSKRVD